MIAINFEWLHLIWYAFIQQNSADSLFTSFLCIQCYWMHHLQYAFASLVCILLKSFVSFYCLNDPHKVMLFNASHWICEQCSCYCWYLELTWCSWLLAIIMIDKMQHKTTYPVYSFMMRHRVIPILINLISVYILSFVAFFSSMVISVCFYRDSATETIRFLDMTWLDTSTRQKGFKQLNALKWTILKELKCWEMKKKHAHEHKGLIAWHS